MRLIASMRGQRITLGSTWYDVADHITQDTALMQIAVPDVELREFLVQSFGPITVKRVAKRIAITQDEASRDAYLVRMDEAITPDAMHEIAKDVAAGYLRRLSDQSHR